jgi:hypothetical protein
MTRDFEKEAKITGRYLLDGKDPNAQSISLFQNAMRVKPVKLSARDEKILAYIYRHPGSLGLIDSALGFFGRQSGVRRLVLFMSAILETQPEYAELFLPKERSWFYNVYIFFVGVRAVVKGLLGRILLIFIS